MRRLIIPAVVLLVLAAAAAGGWWYVNEHPEWWFWLQDQYDQAVVELGLAPAEGPPGLVASGFIEAEEVSVAAERGGRILSMGADEGDAVEAGQLLVQLDDQLLQVQIRSAVADLAVAEATLAQARSGVQQATLDRAQAQVEQARTAQEAAYVAWQDAEAMLENPQELALALTAARGQLAVLGEQAQQAEAQAASAQAASDFADEAVRLLQEVEPHVEWVLVGSYTPDTLPPEIPLPPCADDCEYTFGEYKIVVKDGTIYLYRRVRIAVPAAVMDEALHRQATSAYQAWQAWTGAAQANVAVEGTEDYLGELSQQVSNPLTLQAQAHAAEAQYQVATAAVGMAEAQLEGMKMGATPEQIAALEAQVEMARAALDVWLVQLDKFTLVAPISGLVLERPVRSGEVALPGSPLMTLADLEHMTLTVYVPEDQLGRVYLGQPVSVTVDAYPERAFGGTVTYISNEAEFTPRNIQTQEERVNMVFGVRIDLPNPQHALKPGMPADAVLLEAPAGGGGQ
ncbi:MAG: efflux RND transporter periplasmic adaptor subunit [Anaerolineae bacterium]|nr:efflux RND transporter periplasmic adaptor subunit [Anaerolineae bacterium]